MKISKTVNFIIWLPRVLFCAAATACLGFYLRYIASILAFPYQWEPTDGDHLNFAHRIAQGLPIYLSLKSGQVLSIYNPLYHTLIAILGGPHAGMILGRSIALIAWVLIPIGVFVFYRHRWGMFYALIAAIFIMLPPERMMLIYMVQVSPDVLMAFLFFATLLLAERCTEKTEARWWEWASIGVLACLCFLAKQQGIIALASAGVYLLIRRVRFNSLLWTTGGFLFIFIISSTYFQWMNHGEYFRATLFDLHKIMIVTPGLARQRFVDFLFNKNRFFFACICAGLALVIFRISRLTVWQVSFFLHIPFLLKILGNEGGGRIILQLFGSPLS